MADATTTRPHFVRTNVAFRITKKRSVGLKESLDSVAFLEPERRDLLEPFAAEDVYMFEVGGLLKEGRLIRNCSIVSMSRLFLGPKLGHWTNVHLGR